MEELALFVLIWNENPYNIYFSVQIYLTAKNLYLQVKNLQFNEEVHSWYL